MVTKQLFGTTKKGEEVFSFLIEDDFGSMTVLTYGGIVQSLCVPDRNGNKVDVLLGYKTLKEYEEGTSYFGALIGRTANRIGKGEFVLDGVKYTLPINNGPNTNHGGDEFNNAIWQGEEIENGVKLTYTSPDGTNGYPGNLKMEVTYTFEKGVLRITYQASADRKTIIAPTWHGYFNLNGEAKGDAMENELCILADKMIPSDENLLPYGTFESVEGTPFDFRTMKEIKRDIRTQNLQLVQGRGYDHSFLFGNEGRMEQVATAYSKETGIEMQIVTDAPSMQLYTANYVDEMGKSGYYGYQSGYALETGLLTNNINIPAFQAISSSILEQGEPFRSVTEYRFGVKS